MVTVTLFYPLVPSVYEVLRDRVVPRNYVMSVRKEILKHGNRQRTPCRKQFKKDVERGSTGIDLIYTGTEPNTKQNV